MIGNGAVIGTVFASVHVSLYEDVKPLLRSEAFKGLDFALERQQADILISAHFGWHKKLSAIKCRRLKYIVNEYLHPCFKTDIYIYRYNVL